MNNPHPFLLSLSFALSLSLTSCSLVQPETPDYRHDGNSNMNIVAPFVEPPTDWTLDYKGLINTMTQQGYVTTRVEESAVHYDLYASSSQGGIGGSALRLQTAIVRVDTARNYCGAVIVVESPFVSHATILRYLDQQYTRTGYSDYPLPEHFYRSTTRADSILVSCCLVNGCSRITYDKGMNP